MAAPSIDPSFYADLAGLTALKKNVKADDPAAIRAAAQQFESLFTDMLLQSMRQAKLGDGLGDSQQTQFYQQMYDQQLALTISRGRGLGLADMLVQQLTRRGLAPQAAASGGQKAHKPGGTLKSDEALKPGTARPIAPGEVSS